MKLALLLATLTACVFPTQAKPLKVFILAGQSNMEGPASVKTFDYIGDDPATAPLLKQMHRGEVHVGKVPGAGMSGPPWGRAGY